MTFTKKLFNTHTLCRKQGHGLLGFTLSEILITLGIIGVIAALTIPNLINNAKNTETVSKVKKTYSVLSQAFIQAQESEGAVENWNWIANDSGPGAENVMATLAPYLSVIKNCGNGSGCFPNAIYLLLDNTNNVQLDTVPEYAKAILAGGTTIAIGTRAANCDTVRGASLALTNVCGVIFIDVNGFKGPNQHAKDLFGFYITKYGIIPLGTSTDSLRPPSDCDKTMTGMACAAWILEKGNMDYLK